MNSIASDELLSRMHTDKMPVVIDVRRLPAFEKSARMISTALWRDHALTNDWAQTLPEGKDVVVYCVHGQQVSQAAVAILRTVGIKARYLIGGFDAWENTDGSTLPRAEMTGHQGKQWVTRENSGVDGVACPWLIRRFIDPMAVFHYVEAEWVQEVAVETGAIVFGIDAPDTTFAHDKEMCSFDAFVRHFDIRDPATKKMATIVRGAKTAKPDLAPQAAGLEALSQGLSTRYADDLERLEKGMIFYDALYGWCQSAA